MKRLVLILTIFLVLSGSSMADEAVYQGLANFTRVLNLIERNYVEEVDSEELTESAIQGMLRTLDPYSAYLTPERFRELEIGTTGEFGGVGMEVTVENGILTVITPIEGTPAERAGIKPKDQIIEVDGKPTKGLVTQEVVNLLRGPRGSTVNVTVLTPGEKEPRVVTLTRDKIVVKSVKPELLPEGIAYIKLSQFQDNTSVELKEALADLKANNNGNLRGIVLDLRNNPGGLLSEAIEVVDEFVDDGLIVSVKGRYEGQSRDHYATKNGDYEDEPVVVIVNDGSASASEVVAEALQDSKRAVILGTSTFGKGSVQTIIKLEDGSGLKLTTAKFYAPSGRSINEVGVKPDVVVENKKDKDTQLERAVNILKGTAPAG